MMKRKLRITPKIIEISEADYISFISQLPKISEISPDISRLTDPALLLDAQGIASNIFDEAINIVKNELSEAHSGIVAVDIPESPQVDVDENAFWGVALATAFGSNIFHLSRDKINKTPFTVYAASYEKSGELAEFGLKTVAPETKLGFHSDGVINGSGILMPKNIMLYNVVIEYGRAGCFHWVPFDLWREKKIFMDRVGVGKRYSIKLTPSIYDLGDGRLEVTSPDKVNVPVFPDNEENRYPLYINGKIIGCEDRSHFDPDLFDELKQSIENNLVRYSIPQKNRRIIFARNIAGAHARDIFEEPVGNPPYTRIFLRSVDMDAVNLDR
jgi:hypothetical protein